MDKHQVDGELFVKPIMTVEHVDPPALVQSVVPILKIIVMEEQHDPQVLHELTDVISDMNFDIISAVTSSTTTVCHVTYFLCYAL